MPGGGHRSRPTRRSGLRPAYGITFGLAVLLACAALLRAERQLHYNLRVISGGQQFMSRTMNMAECAWNTLESGRLFSTRVGVTGPDLAHMYHAPYALYPLAVPGPDPPQGYRLFQDVSAPDDWGFSLLFVLAWAVTGIPTLHSVQSVYLALDVAMILVAFVAGRRLAGVFGGFLAAGLLTWGNAPVMWDVLGLQPHPIVFYLCLAVAMFAAVPPHRRAWWHLLLLGCVVGLGQTMRAVVILLPGALFAGDLLCHRALRPTLKGATWCVLGMALVLAPYANYFARHSTRDALPGHTFWHNFYIGLGEFENDFGIEYADQNAFEYAVSVDPTIVSLSEEYDDVLRARARTLITAHPGWYASVIARRFWRTTTLDQYPLGDRVPWIVGLVLGCVLAYRRWGLPGLAPALPCLYGLWITIPITTAYPNYYLGGRSLFLLYTGVGVGLVGEAVWPHLRAATQPALRLSLWRTARRRAAPYRRVLGRVTVGLAALMLARVAFAAIWILRYPYPWTHREGLLLNHVARWAEGGLLYARYDAVPPGLLDPPGAAFLLRPLMWMLPGLAAERVLALAGMAVVGGSVWVVARCRGAPTRVRLLACVLAVGVPMLVVGATTPPAAVWAVAFSFAALCIAVEAPASRLGWASLACAGLVVAGALCQVTSVPLGLTALLVFGARDRRWGGVALGCTALAGAAGVLLLHHQAGPNAFFNIHQAWWTMFHAPTDIFALPRWLWVQAPVLTGVTVLHLLTRRKAPESRWTFAGLAVLAFGVSWQMISAAPLTGWGVLLVLMLLAVEARGTGLPRLRGYWSAFVHVALVCQLALWLGTLPLLPTSAARTTAAELAAIVHDAPGPVLNDGMPGFLVLDGRPVTADAPQLAALYERDRAFGEALALRVAAQEFSSILWSNRWFARIPLLRRNILDHYVVSRTLTLRMGDEDTLVAVMSPRGHPAPPSDPAADLPTTVESAR